MKEPEFSARGVRIGKGLRSLTRAGQVRITDGRLELLTSAGREIDSAPVQAVRTGKSWFGGGATAEVNGTRYSLTLGEGQERGDSDRPRTARRFLDAVRKARTNRS